MKRSFKYLILLLLILLPLTLCGCNENEDDNNNDGGIIENTTYTVNISVNTSEGGSVSRDNEKDKYKIGDVINLTITPNYGYYFRGYSDINDKTLTRKIVVNGNMDILVNFSEGEACSFYGYYIALENAIEIKTMLSVPESGNVSTFIKSSPNCIITSGKLELYNSSISDYCWEFTHSLNQTKKIFSSFSTQTILTENDFILAFGESGKGEWIDIVKNTNYVGAAYAVRQVGQGKDDACFEKSGEFVLDDFSNTELVYVYRQDELHFDGFTQENNVTYSYSLSGNKTEYIQVFKLFEVEGKVYFFTNSKVEYMLTKGDSMSFKITIQEVEYTVTFNY